MLDIAEQCSSIRSTTWAMKPGQAKDRDMVKAAEFYGHCQACDRMQKLPNGVLAKHGYQVIERGNYGYFAGACKGSGHSPYEEDCTWIKTFLIPEARKEEKRLVDFCAKLRIAPIVPIAHHQIYGMFGPHWAQVKLLGQPDHKYPALQEPQSRYNETGIVPAHRFTWLPNVGEATPEALLKLAAAMDEYYATQIERWDLLKVRRYIEWQEKRVADWKLRPLPPVDMTKMLKKASEKAFTEREARFVAQNGEAA